MVSKWSKRRKKFNKMFDVKKHHLKLIVANARKLYLATLKPYILCGYPSFNKEIVKGMLNTLYGKRS